MIAASSAEKYFQEDLVRIALEAWQDDSYYDDTDLDRSMAARDQAMATLFERIKAHRFPSAKVVVWAHDYHVFEADVLMPGVLNMGALLHQAYGADYYTIGMFARQTDIDWLDVGCGEQPHDTSPSSAEEQLHALRAGDLFIDLSFGGASQPFFKNDMPVLFEDFEYWTNSSFIPSSAAQALLYLEHSAAMHPVDRPSCVPDGGAR